jgi:hypothetical protein
MHMPPVIHPVMVPADVVIGAAVIPASMVAHVAIAA